MSVTQDESAPETCWTVQQGPIVNHTVSHAENVSKGVDLTLTHHE